MPPFSTGITTAAVCVYPARVCDAVRALKAAGCDIPVASGKVCGFFCHFFSMFPFNSDTLRYYLYSYFILFIFDWTLTYSSWPWAGATLSCGVQASHCRGFSCCRAQALGVWVSVVVACGLSSCGAWVQLPEACGVLVPTPETDSCPLRCKADS